MIKDGISLMRWILDHPSPSAGLDPMHYSNARMKAEKDVARKKVKPGVFTMKDALMKAGISSQQSHPSSPTSTQ